MRSSFACRIASLLAACIAVRSSEAAEGLCLLQTKAAKHGRIHHSEETALSDADDSPPEGARLTNEQAVLLSSSSGRALAHADELSDDKKLQGITDLEAYGGSMMDLVLGGWRHSHENPSKKSAAATSSFATAAVEVAHTPSVAVAPKAHSISKQEVDAFGDPIRDMEVDLLSTAPARVRVDPILEDAPPVEVAESAPSEELADNVLAEAQKSLEEYSAVLSETEKISLLGQSADESEIHQVQEEGITQKRHSRQHHESTADSSSVHHAIDRKSVVQQKVAATEHMTTKKPEFFAQKTDSIPVDGEAHSSKDKSARASVRQPLRQQKHPHVPAIH